MKVQFMPGISSMRGSMKTRNGKRIMFCKRKGDKPGFGRMFIREKSAFQRSTEPTEKEIRQREKFCNVSRTITEMSEEHKEQFAAEWQANKRIFNGKEYVTLRGYIMARLMAMED